MVNTRITQLVEDIADGDYAVSVVDGKIDALVAQSGGGGGGSIVYGALSKNAVIARNQTSTNTWLSQKWVMAHDKYLLPLSYVCDIFQTDTYTLYIDGRSYGLAASTGGAAPYALSISLSGEDLAPGPHLYELRPTAARRMYYSSVLGVLPTGTGIVGFAWGQWATSTEATVHGTFTFDYEGVES